MNCWSRVHSLSLTYFLMGTQGDCLWTTPTNILVMSWIMLFRYLHWKSRLLLTVLQTERDNHKSSSPLLVNGSESFVQSCTVCLLSFYWCILYLFTLNNWIRIAVLLLLLLALVLYVVQQTNDRYIFFSPLNWRFCHFQVCSNYIIWASTPNTQAEYV